MADWEAHYLPDIEYIVWIRPYEGKPDAPMIEVQAVRVVTFGEDNMPIGVSQKDWKHCGDDTGIEDREGSDHLLQGWIKWDGCSNIEFDTGLCPPHFCNRADAVKAGTLLGHLYDICWEFYFKDGPYAAPSRDLYEGG